jgi:hypothetical protein
MRLTAFRVPGPGRVALGVLAVLSGCGLISSDIATFTFQLPSKSFSFDTASAGWKAPPSYYNAPVPCGAGQAVADCCNPPAPAPKPDCSATPSQLACVSSVCALQFPFSVSQNIDLKKEVPSLSSLGGQTLASISIKQIQYTIASTMNVALPAMDIYVAPATVTTLPSAMATKFGTVPATPAGATKSGDVVMDPAGQATFSQYLSAFTTPFNLIAYTVVVLPSGSPTPTGKVDVTVTGTISAKPNL